MDQRGRRSAADLAVISPDGIVSVRRPEPLAELTDEQAHIWRTIVNRMSADWFPVETHGLLAQYCRHVVAANRVAQLINEIEKAEDIDVTHYDRLLKMQEREGRALSSLATRMRLTQQVVHDRERKKPKQTAKKPWE